MPKTAPYHGEYGSAVRPLRCRLCKGPYRDGGFVHDPRCTKPVRPSRRSEYDRQDVEDQVLRGPMLVCSHHGRTEPCEGCIEQGERAWEAEERPYV